MKRWFVLVAVVSLFAALSVGACASTLIDWIGQAPVIEQEVGDGGGQMSTMGFIRPKGTW